MFDIVTRLRVPIWCKLSGAEDISTLQDPTFAIQTSPAADASRSWLAVTDSPGHRFGSVTAKEQESARHNPDCLSVVLMAPSWIRAAVIGGGAIQGLRPEDMASPPNPGFKGANCRGKANFSTKGAHLVPIAQNLAFAKIAPVSSHARNANEDLKGKEHPVAPSHLPTQVPQHTVSI